MPSIKEIARFTKTKRHGYEHFLDYLANYVVKMALYLRITPTQLTFLWVLSQFLALFLLLLGNYGWSLLAVILFQFMFVVDLSDGKLSRYQRSLIQLKKPLFPKYLDRLGHFFSDSFLFLFLGIGTASRYENNFYAYLGFAAAFFFLLNKAITVNPAWYKTNEECLAVKDAFWQSTPRATKSKLRQFFFDFTRVEHLFGLLFFGMLLNLPHLILVVYPFLFFAELVRKLLAQGIFLWKTDNKNKF